MTRHYFTKAHSDDKPVKVPKKKLPPRAAYILIQTPDGMRKWNARRAAQQVGRSNGGRAIHRLGLAHRWTSEEAKAAAHKVWNTRWKMKMRIGARVGRPAKNRTRVDHQAMRELHTDSPVYGIQYVPPVQYIDRRGHVGYWITGEGDEAVQISERTALTRLGYLPSPRGFVPRKVYQP